MKEYVPISCFHPPVQKERFLKLSASPQGLSTSFQAPDISDHCCFLPEAVPAFPLPFSQSSPSLQVFMLEQKLFYAFRDILYPLFIQRCVYILPAFKFTQFSRRFMAFMAFVGPISFIYAENKVISFIPLALDLQNKFLTSLTVVPS